MLNPSMSGLEVLDKQNFMIKMTNSFENGEKKVQGFSPYADNGGYVDCSYEIAIVILYFTVGVLWQLVETDTLWSPLTPDWHQGSPFTPENNPSFFNCKSVNVGL